MAFFGCEVKPNKPFSFGAKNPIKGRLHLCLATLGMGSSRNKSVLQCISRDTGPVFVCSLFPDKYETCQLGLEFEEVDDVVFSVVGPRSIHLTGYYVSRAHHHLLRDDLEPFEEYIASTESEKSTDDEEYGGSFINDGDPGVYSTSYESDVEKKSNLNKLLKDSYKSLRKKHQLNVGGSKADDRLWQCQDLHPKHRDYASDSDSIESFPPFIPSSLLNKISTKVPDAGQKLYKPNRESTSKLYKSSSSLVNKKFNNGLAKVKKDSWNIDKVQDLSNFAPHLEPKRKVLDENQELKKIEMQRNKRKVSLVEGIESIDIEKDGHDSPKKEVTGFCSISKRRIAIENVDT